MARFGFQGLQNGERGGMKTIRNMLILVLFAVGGAVWLAGNAMAAMDMSEKETVQAIAWIVEIVAFITAVAIAWFVLRLVKRDGKDIKSERDDS
jgi:hypothetical protein